MAIRISCDSCGATIKADDKHAGKRVRCPKCQEILTIPAASTPEGEDDGESDFFEDTRAAAPPPPPPAPKSTFRPATSRPPGTPTRRAPPSDAPLNRERPAPPPEKETALPAEEETFGFAAGPEQTAAAVEDDFSSLSSSDLADGEPMLEDAPRKPKKKKKKGEAKRARRLESEAGWRQHLHWFFLAALIPLCLSSLMQGEPIDERVTATMEEHKIDESNLDFEEDGDFNVLQQVAMATPDHRINGAFLAADSHLHWLFAALSAAFFLGLFMLRWPQAEAGPARLIGTGLLTGTVGIMLLLAFQFIAVWTMGFNVRGRSILVLLFYLIKFIGFSYRCAIDANTGFGLSFMGFTCGVGLCEELCKAIPIAIYLNSTPKATWRDACLVGLASGVGFGVSEGITYSGSYYNGIQESWIYLVRFISCVALHALWAGAIGILMYHNQDYIGELSWENAGMFVAFYLSIGMILHGLYDTFLKSDLELGALITAGVTFGWFAFMVNRARSAEAA